MLVRVSIFLILFFGVFLLPWWAVFFFVFVELLRRQAPELLFVALAFDALYGVDRAVFFGIPWVMTLVCVCLWALGMLLRTRVITKASYPTL